MNPAGVGSPWARRGLRCNPFGEPPLEELPRLVVAELDDLFAWWNADARRALQWIGPCGHGKSAHLAALRGRDLSIPWVYLAEDEPIPPIPSAPGLILDEAQRLPRWRRWRLFRRLDRIAIGTHEDLRRELEGAGFGVRTLRVDALQPGRLGEILERRLAWGEVVPGAAPRPGDEQIAGLERRYGGDVRALLDHLYEVFQAWVHAADEDPWNGAGLFEESSI